MMGHRIAASDKPGAVQKAIIVNAPAALREQLDRVTGKMTLIRRLAALRPGPITSTTASAKIGLRAISRR